MVVRCKICKNTCINWESTMQSCKCGNIIGFHKDEHNISVLSPDLDNVLIWKNDMQGWEPYDKTHNYPVETWQGYAGQPFEIFPKKKVGRPKKSLSNQET